MGRQMLERLELRKLARARLRDAEVLISAKRFDAAAYLAGYAVELALKARICRTLNWAGYPDTAAEFQSLTSFRTHNLDVLLRLSGREDHVKSQAPTDWWIATQWRPEVRYRELGSVNKTDAEEIMEASRNLVRVLQ